MASGQKLLSDLVGITSSATDSLWSSKLLKEIEEDEDNDASGKLQPGTKREAELDEAKNVSISFLDEAISNSSKGRLKTEKSMKIDDVSHKDISCTRMHLVPLDGDVSDHSRCLEAKVLLEKDNSLDASHGSQIETPSNASSERLPTPDASGMYTIFICQSEVKDANVLLICVAKNGLLLRWLSFKTMVW